MADIKAIFNYSVGDPIVIVPPDPISDIITIKAQVSNVSTPVVAMADFKFNKDIALGFGFDDALMNHYTMVYPKFMSKLYSDGAGGQVHFNATLVIPPGALRVVDNEDGANSYSIAKAKQMFDSGFRINNHSYYHGGGTTPWDIVDTIKKGEQLLYDNMGYRPIIGTTPAAELGYLRTFGILGYYADNTTFNESDSAITIYGKMRPDQFPANYVSFDRQWFGDDWLGEGPQQMKAYIDEIVGNAVGGVKMFGNMFSHGPGDTTNFNDVMDYVLGNNGGANADRIWVPSVPEYWSYFLVKRKSIITKSLSGSELTITIDQSLVDPNVIDRDMSLLLSGLNISSITSVTGVDKYTVNPSTGLLNLYKIDKTKTINPSASVLPAQLKTFVGNGNSVNITFDKAITQSIAAGYTINDTPATSISGSGTNWTINFNTSVSGKQMFYYSHIGNAITVGTSTPVCDYPHCPIT